VLRVEVAGENEGGDSEAQMDIDEDGDESKGAESGLKSGDLLPDWRKRSLA